MEGFGVFYFGLTLFPTGRRYDYRSLVTVRRGKGVVPVLHRSAHVTRSSGHEVHDRKVVLDLVPEETETPTSTPGRNGTFFVTSVQPER